MSRQSHNTRRQILRKLQNSLTRTIVFEGYKLIRHRLSGNYEVETPSGEVWRELACNIETAKKWVRCDLAAKAARKIGRVNDPGR